MDGSQLVVVVLASFFRQVSVLSLLLPNTVSLLLESVLHCCVPDVYCLRCTWSDFELRTMGL